MKQPVSNRSMNDLCKTGSPARIPVSRGIVAVLDTRHEGNVSPLLVALARRDNASVVIYDLSTGSRWTTPFETDNAQHAAERVLSAAQLESRGHRTTARAVDELKRAGVVAGAYLASRPAAEDLSDLVWTRHADLVVAPGSLQGRTRRNVERVRRLGATLVESNPGDDLVVHLRLGSETVTEENKSPTDG